MAKRIGKRKECSSVCIDAYFCKENSRGAAGIDAANVKSFDCVWTFDPCEIAGSFRDGADGVLIVACPLTQCRHLKKSRRIDERIASIRRTAIALGLDDKRLRMEWFSAGDKEKLEEVIMDFTEAVRRMGKAEYPPGADVDDPEGKLLQHALAELDACAWSSSKEHVREFAMRRNLFYHPGHMWAKKENGTLVVGIDDFAARLLGRVDTVTLPEANQMVFCGVPGIEVKSGARSAKLLSPVTGIVARVNQRVVENPELVTDDPYRRGWLFTVVPKDLKREVREFLYGYDARKWLESDAEELHKGVEEELGVTMADGGILTGGFAHRLDNDEWSRLTKKLFRT